MTRRIHAGLAVLVAAFAIGAGPVSPRVALRGVNMAGAEFAPGALPGRPGTDFVYPTAAQLDWATGMGFTVIRLPLLWERLQPTLARPLDPATLAALHQVIVAAAARHLSVIVDVHNYAAYRGHRIGTPEVPDAAFADLWRRLAGALRPDRTTIFGLMNEPNGLTAEAWLPAAQGAIDAIRATGARNLVLVAGVGWDGAHNFVSGAGYGTPNATVLASIHDPAGAIAFEAHQYLDADYSGTHADCPAAGRAAQLLAPFTEWLRAGRRHGVLGEFGVPARPECLAALNEMLRYMDANSDVWTGWTYWAAGAWWGPDYPFSIEPSGGADRPQAQILRKP